MPSGHAYSTNNEIITPGAVSPGFGPCRVSHGIDAGEACCTVGSCGEDVMRKCSAELLEVLDDLGPEEQVKVWIFFSDRGGEHRTRPETERIVSQRALRRVSLRSTKDPSSSLLLPVCGRYIESIIPLVMRVRHVSRYFNAVSAEASCGNISGICSLEFVKKVSVVAVFRKKRIPATAAARGDFHGSRMTDPYFSKYGESLDQLDMLHVTDLLELGYDGSGSKTGNPPVLICVLDTGFDLDHEALEGVNVVAEYDFVQSDSVTSDEVDDIPGQDEHGTRVLGTIAGFHEGDLIGPACGAEYILAKTEIRNDPFDVTVEEDNWVAGIEWAEGLGADIVTSSVGYVNWYHPAMMDGDTPLCTQAADIAASLGVVVVNAVGNRGFYGDTSMVAPADGDSVIAVGAVDRHGVIAYFSSRGPTSDGRIKPDLTAMGVGVRTVDGSTRKGYGNYDGTSFAAPLISGLCALLLELHTDWTPAQVLEALITTSSRKDSPDNSYGYGIPNGLDASGMEEPDGSDLASMSAAYPNPFNDHTIFNLYFPERESVSARVFDSRGALVRTLMSGRSVRWSGALTWDGVSNMGSEVASGVYYVLFESRTVRKVVKVIRIR